MGEDKTLVYENLDDAGAPISMSGWAVKLYVRSKDNSPDPAIFDKTASVTGSFNADRTLNTQRASVTLTDDELNTVKAKTYRHSWKRMDAGFETVLAYGDFVVEKATAP